MNFLKRAHQTCILPAIALSSEIRCPGKFALSNCGTQDECKAKRWQEIYAVKELHMIEASGSTQPNFLTSSIRRMVMFRQNFLQNSTHFTGNTQTEENACELFSEKAIVQSWDLTCLEFDIDMKFVSAGLKKKK